MKFKYIGTGASEGIPSLFCSCRVCTNARKSGGREVRHRSSAIIDTDLMVDISPDTFSQAVSLGLDLSRLRQLLITHSHYDHFYVRELINIRPSFASRPIVSKLVVLSSAGTMKELKSDISPEMFNILKEYIDFVELKLFTPYESGEYTFTPLLARHGTAEPFIYIIEKEGRKILYANDSGFFPEKTWDYIYGIHFDFVTLDCTHQTRIGTAGHMCVEDDITVKKRMFQQGNIDGKTRIAATHFAHSDDMTYFQIDEQLRLYGIAAAYDGMEINI